MKLKRPNLAQIGIMLGLVGIYLTAATVVPEAHRLEAVIGALVASVFTIYGFLHYVSREPREPIGHDYQKRFRLKFPCTEKEIVEANDIAKRCFGKRSVTPDEHFLGLYRHNRLTALTLYDQQYKKTVGYIDVYPVTTEYLNGLRDGRYYEEELSTRTVLLESKTPSTECVYIAGIVVDDRLKPYDHDEAGACLLLAYVKYFDIILCSGSEHKVRIGALAYTPDGIRLLTKNGFKLTMSEKQRGRDGDYYERTTVTKRGAFGRVQRKELKLPERVCDFSMMENLRIGSSG